jgi:hypothetical protein
MVRFHGDRFTTCTRQSPYVLGMLGAITTTKTAVKNGTLIMSGRL